jgi:hypothetical protein
MLDCFCFFVVEIGPDNTHPRLVLLATANLLLSSRNFSSGKGSHITLSDQQLNFHLFVTVATIS